MDAADSARQFDFGKASSESPFGHIRSAISPYDGLVSQSLPLLRARPKAAMIDVSDLVYEYPARRALKVRRPSDRSADRF